VSDIDTEVVDNLKVLDPRRPIREAIGLMRHSKTTRSAKSRHSALQQIFLFDRVVGETDGTIEQLANVYPHVA
jgi:hypothetical protein